MQLVQSQRAGKNLFAIHLKKQDPPITIRSNFDSGNLAKIELGLNNTLVLTPANDCAGTEYEGLAKGWFHFAVNGFGVGARQKFIIRRMNQLGGSTKFSDYFKPVYKYGQQGTWERIQQAVTFNKQDDTQLHFQFLFQKNSQVFIAYSFPFSFQQNQKMLTSIKNEAKLNKNIYFWDQVLIKSVQGRPVHLVTISSHDQKLAVKQSPINDYLFPNCANRSSKFSETKRVVIISARVHPGQTPSSHTMNGILKFLVSKDARAQLLRKSFVFKIVPMLNPDGVYNGHYRMDIFNQNLNRFYQTPDPIKQPSSFALKKLGQYFKLQNRLCFFMDLHAHPQKKGNFIYGNSIEDNNEQIETQLYPKLLSLNCVQFDYQNSCFSKNHMTFKDRNEDFTKQGCSRVVFHKQLGVIYSYTMQCGYTISNYFNQLYALTNPHRKVDKLGIIHSQMDNVKSPYYSNDKKRYLSIRSYQNLGRCILISILDLFQLNQFSRLPNGLLKSLQQVRFSIGQSLLKLNKDYKTYEKKSQPPLTNLLKRISKQTSRNPTNQLTKSLPKAIISFPQRKIISSKIITRNSRQGLRKTLPKMKQLK